jgi:hypothetical protein
MMMPRRLVRLCLGALGLALASCGLLGAPVRVVGGLTRATVEGGQQLYHKSEQAIARRKRAKAEAAKAKDRQQAEGDQAKAGEPATSQAQGGLLPDLPPEPPPESTPPTGAQPPPGSYAPPENLPPLPE